jgi:hypothetical protein
MNTKAYLLSLGCFILGLALSAGVTYYVATLHYGKIAAEGMLAIESARLTETSQRTLDAYRNETMPVKIYALSQYLIALERAKKIPENPFSIKKRGVSLIMMTTHGRLAKLYAEIGQTNLSAQHVAEALNCAAELNSSVTNQVALAGWVAKEDEMVEKAQRRFAK